MATYTISTPDGEFDIESEKDLDEGGILKAVEDYKAQESGPKEQQWSTSPIPGIPGIGGEKLAPMQQAMPQNIPAPSRTDSPTLKNIIFPSTTMGKEQKPLPIYDRENGNITGYVMGEQQNPLEPIADVGGLATRTAGAALGQGDISDPETGALRVAREYTSGVMQDPEANWLQKGAAGVGYLGASIVEDPTVAIPFIGGTKLGAKAINTGLDIAKAPLSKTGKILEGGAKRVQNTILKPRTQDVKSGFDIDKVFQYDMQGSLDEVLEKSNSKISEASNNLKGIIKQGKDNGVRINVKDAIAKAEKEIYQSTTSKAKNAGEILEYKGALKKLKAIAEEVAEDGNLDLVDAQYFKQSMGDMGAWEHIANKRGVSIPKDENALSKLAAKVNLILKESIEKAAPEGVREQNKIMSDLIPINRAATYRKIIADRNNPISMSDMMGALATIGGGPKGWALWSALRAQKSGVTVKAFNGLAKKLQSATTPSDISRYSNALKKLGVTQAELKLITAPQTMQNNEKQRLKTPKVGKVMKGYTFKGGDPSKEENWTR